MNDDAAWEELMSAARSRGWLKFCHESIAVIERPAYGCEEKGASDSQGVSGAGGGEGGRGGDGRNKIEG